LDRKCGLVLKLLVKSLILRPGGLTLGIGSGEKVIAHAIADLDAIDGLVDVDGAAGLHIPAGVYIGLDGDASELDMFIPAPLVLLPSEQLMPDMATRPAMELREGTRLTAPIFTPLPWRRAPRLEVRSGKIRMQNGSWRVPTGVFGRAWP
jgi:hypothetical protein